jgi:hypothetical protein
VGGVLKIECSSVISRVVVHSRGALVTRDVELPSELTDGIVDIDVPGITLHAEPGSARAALEGSDRVVSSVQASMVIPKGDARPGPTHARVRELSARIARIGDETRALNERRVRFAEVSLTPQLRTVDRRQRERDAFDVRFSEALAMAQLLKEKVHGLDERILRLEKEHRDLSRELEAARLEDLQTSAAERAGALRPRRTITARLVGDGRPGRLLVTYAVAAARWWPTYTLRVGETSDGGDLRAMWTFDAMVAQYTEEDWSAVALSLSSADLVFDARLPELTSLRFGRAQAPKRRPFRPAPAGVDEMFAAYSTFAARAGRPPPTQMAAQMMPHGIARAADLGAFDEPDLDDDSETLITEFQGTSAVKTMRLDLLSLDGAAAREARGGFAPPPPRAHAAAPAPPAFAPPPAAPMMMPQQAMPMRASMPEPKKRQRAIVDGIVSAMALEEGGGVGADGEMAKTDLASELETAPGAQWTDYDRLVLAGPSEPSRGRLVPRTDALRGGDRSGSDAAVIARGLREVNGAADARFRDPAESRGMFDYRYEAAGRADVPTDGRVHRVSVGTEASPVRIGWRSVPSETPEVFREAHFTNPFDTGLLGGPVDVYLDGSLLATTTIDRIDRGGSLFCGMGVDDRIKIARNVRASEESAGLLGGSISVSHVVDIEVSSTIKDPVKVTILERVPVTDDKSLEVKILEERPPAAAYDQSDRGDPVRGGVRFEVVTTPGKKTPISLAYRLVFSQKLEIVGGNRRG